MQSEEDLKHELTAHTLQLRDEEFMCWEPSHEAIAVLQSGYYIADSGCF